MLWFQIEIIKIAFSVLFIKLFMTYARIFSK